jgi:hypothetical protein
MRYRNALKPEFYIPLHSPRVMRVSLRVRRVFLRAIRGILRVPRVLHD